MSRLLLHCILLVGVCQILVQHGVAFAPPQVSTTASRRHSGLCMTRDDGTSGDNRRDFLASLWGVSGLTLLSQTPAAVAEEVELKRANNAVAAFDDLRFELNDPKGGVATIQSMIEKEDYPAIMEFTKGYDITLRKEKMGRAKKQLTDAAFRDTGTLTMNAVTFDLIGINKSSRPGQENKDNAAKYLKELRTDLGNMIKLEETIDYTDMNAF